MRDVSEERGEAHKTHSPFLKVFLIVLVLLLLPALMYSIAPEGPIKEGDTVFSNGRHRVQLVRHNTHQQVDPNQFCIVEPHTPLIVVQRPPARPGGIFQARVQGTTRAENPFCAPQAEIILHLFQVNQRRGLLQEFKQKILAFL